MSCGRHLELSLAAMELQGSPEEASSSHCVIASAERGVPELAGACHC